mmetsp:Transcript_2922/g.4487  ORF Transcript_2922/g.4487 Transcript_2922/m.4487 type:complete len:837 (+) Transcript_2922:95-2605(+)
MADNTVDEKAAFEAIKVPSQSNKVYNRECVFSFQNPYSPGGLYVNLKTFQGVGPDFLPLDQKRNRFPIYLHQQWKRKAKKDAEEDKPTNAPTKFAIGVEGGFQLDDQKIDIIKINTVVVVGPDGKKQKSYPFDGSDKVLPKNVVQSVNSVLARTDSTESKDIFAGSLEEEVKESKFAKDLVQLDNGKKIPNDHEKWACEDSGLKKNLWLNLSTGYIGSGRKETGGTEAAIKHYEDTGRKYPLVVKLGTITPEKVEIYSYAENAMVSDALIDKHLAHWGLDRKKLFQTDKDMTQLSIEAQSKAFEASLITGEGEKQEVATGVGYQGLVNFGNTCYLNSTFQLLFSVPEFKKRYVEFASRVFERSPSDPAADITTQLSKLATALNSDKYQGETDEHKKLKEDTKLPELSDPAAEVKPKMLKKAVARDHWEFSGGRQQDAQEYILHVFQAISRDAKQFPSTPGNSDLTKLFEFASEEKTVDAQSKQVGYKIQPGQTFLQVPIPKPQQSTSKKEEDPEAAQKESGEPKEKKSKTASSSSSATVAAGAKMETVEYEACFKRMLEAYTLQGYTSPVTQQKGVAYRSSRMRTFPQYLFIQMLRFEQVDMTKEGKGYQIQKIRRMANMPVELDIKMLASTGLQKGETALPKAKKAKPQAKPEIVVAVTSMGFSQNAGIRAALATQNAGAEQAVNWVLMHSQDADINDPIQDGDDDDEEEEVDAGKVSQVAAMGFNQKHAIKALKATDGDVARAIDWLFSRAGQLDDDSSSEQKKKKIEPGQNTDSPKYKIMGFISHIGDRATSGHYVCHILKDNGKWVLYNDNKVTYCEKPPLGLGYIYLYRRV